MTNFISYAMAREVAADVYQSLGTLPDGWQFDTSFNKTGVGAAGSGAYVYALKPIGVDDGRRILAFRGTEFELSKPSDLYADVSDIGENQFNSIRPIVDAWLASK